MKEKFLIVGTAIMAASGFAAGWFLLDCLCAMAYGFNSGHCVFY